MARRSKSNSTGNATFSVQVQMGKGEWVDHAQFTAVTACNKESYAVVRKWTQDPNAKSKRAYRGRPDLGYDLLEAHKDKEGNETLELRGRVRVVLTDPALPEPIIGAAASFAATYETLKHIVGTPDA